MRSRVFQHNTPPLGKIAERLVTSCLGMTAGIDRLTARKDCLAEEDTVSPTVLCDAAGPNFTLR